MILFSATIADLIASGQAEVCFALVIRESNDAVFLTSTTHFENVQLDDGVSYTADDFIVRADPPQQSSNVDRESYKLTVTDPTFLVSALGENGLVGKKIELNLCFVNPTTGKIYPEAANRLCVYKGRIEGLEGEINTESIGSQEFVISCASPNMSLEQSRGIYCSRDIMRGRNPNDGCCDKIYTGSTPAVSKWGKS